MNELRSIESWRIESVCPSTAEDDLLMGDEPREADRVDRLVDVGAGVAEQLRGTRRGSGGLVELAVVMQLDDLDLGHELGDPLTDLHHQDGADREVRSHERPPPSPPFQ